MPTLTIALLQMTPFGTDQAANRAKGEQFCRLASDHPCQNADGRYTKKQTGKSAKQSLRNG